MGQKIHPKGFRIGTTFTWSSRWFASDKEYKHMLLSDITLRKALYEKLKHAGLAQVDLERSINKTKVTLHVSRPGVVIGRGGSGLEELKKYIESFFAKEASKKKRASGTPGESNKMKIELSVEPIKEPNLNAYLVAVNIADQLAKRMPHKRVCLSALDRIMGSGAKGAKILLAGRIAGAEIARREKYQQGSVPLSTIREEVDYASIPSLTKSGYIGVKVWICKKR